LILGQALGVEDPVLKKYMGDAELGSIQAYDSVVLRTGQLTQVYQHFADRLGVLETGRHPAGPQQLVFIDKTLRQEKILECRGLFLRVHVVPLWVQVWLVLDS
jgi:hypothetical protein